MRKYLFAPRASMFEIVAYGIIAIAYGAGDIGFWTYLIGLFAATFVAIAAGHDL